MIQLYAEKRLITRDDGQLYMTRWYILKNKYFNLILHKIVLSDHECPHDHPWNFISLILKGGYIEHVEKPSETGGFANCNHYNEETDSYSLRTSKIYHPGQILFRKAEHRHRLEIHQPCWSLVLRFKVKRRWGFWTKSGWIHWKLFNETSDCG